MEYFPLASVLPFYGFIYECLCPSICYLSFFKKVSKKVLPLLAGMEKVCTFATAFERETRLRYEILAMG